MPTILRGVSTSVPIDGTTAPGSGSYAWEIYDVVNNIQIDYATSGTTGVNGWVVTPDSATGGYDITPPSGAAVGGGPNRYQYRYAGT